MGDMADYYDEREDPLDDGRSYGRRTPTAKRTRSYAHKVTPVATPEQKKRLKESALKANRELQQQLRGEEVLLVKEISKLDIPPAPPTVHSMFRVVVQFSPNASRYTYLLVRSGKRWYTTGTKDEQKMFESWSVLCEWLNSTHWHSRLDLLGVDIEGAFPTSRDQEVPF